MNAKDLCKILMGSHPTRTSNAGAVGKNCVFCLVEWSRSLWLRCLTAENLCPSATVICIYDGVLAMSCQLTCDVINIIGCG